MDRRRLIAQLKRDEGFRSKPYRCTADTWTIGYGRNLEAKGISRMEASLMLRNDIDAAIHGLERNLPYWEILDETRQAVLVNMAVNLGIAGLLKFHRMLGAISEADWDKAAEEMLDSRWATQVGKRAKRLAESMRTGKSGD